MYNNKRPNKFKSLVEVPDSVSLEMPDLELKIVEKNEPFSFSRKSQKRKYIFEIIIGVISIIGVGIGLYFAHTANNIASDNRKQDTMINQLKEIVDTLKSSNIKIAQTQENTYRLLVAVLKSNKNFEIVYSPKISLRMTGDFSGKGAGDPNPRCHATVQYFIENSGVLNASSFKGKVAFVNNENGFFTSFYGYRTDMRKELKDLKPDSPIEFGTNVQGINCIEALKFMHCFIIFEYSFYDVISGKNLTYTSVYEHSVSQDVFQYTLTPADKNIEQKIKKWFKTAEITYQPPG